MTDLSRIPAAVLALLGASWTTLAASCPDLTSQLEDLGNPNASRWTSGSTFPRNVPDLFPYQGKIYRYYK